MSNIQLSQVTKWLDDSRPSFDEMNLNKLDFNREREFMIQAFQNNPYLLSMTPDSVRNVLVNCALIGISLNPSMKMAYPVPRKGKLCLDISYMGMIKIVTDTGSVKSIKSSVVYSNEHFDIELGSAGYVKHKPNLTSKDKGTKLGAYSVAILNDGSAHIHWMYAQDIEAIKARSESVKKGKQSPWDSDPDEMWKKTVVKQHWKYLPKSERAEMAANAIAMENDVNGIDFEKEAQKKPDVNVVDLSDIVDKNDEKGAQTFETMKALFHTEGLPDDIDVEGTIYNIPSIWESIEAEYEKGSLLKAKANGWYKFIKQQISNIKK